MPPTFGRKFPLKSQLGEVFWLSAQSFYVEAMSTRQEDEIICICTSRAWPVESYLHVGRHNTRHTELSSVEYSHVSVWNGIAHPCVYPERGDNVRCDGDHRRLDYPRLRGSDA